jgi:acetyltransferase-like isoleucine patch superfamily enzyme
MTSIGFCCGINRGASVGHHNLIKDFSRINPGAHLGGSCTVGPGATIGIGAICLEKMKIGPHAFVGGGSVVTKDVLPDSTVVGIPARPIKKEMFYPIQQSLEFLLDPSKKNKFEISKSEFPNFAL